MGPWRSYRAAQPVSRGAGGELVCPQCGEPISVYRWTSTRNNHQILLAQFWCTPCRLYSGSTGPLPDGFEPGRDPLADLPDEDRQALLLSPGALFDWLDRNDIEQPGPSRA